MSDAPDDEEAALANSSVVSIRQRPAVPVAAVSGPNITLRPFRLNDAQAFWALNSDRDVRKYIGGETLSLDFCRMHMEICALRWETQGYSQCAIVLSDEARLIGRGGINMLDELGELEVSWVIAHSEWGNGYATEAGRAALTFAFRHLRAPSVCAPIHPANVASINVAEKIGMTFDRLVDVYRDGVELAVYRMTANQYAQDQRRIGSGIGIIF